MEQPAILQRVTPTAALQGGFSQAVASHQPQAGASLRARDEVRQGLAIGELHLMIRYEDGSELTEMPQYFRLPNAPDWFCGIANLHGVLTPVFDLCRYLGMDRLTQAKPMLLVLSHGADAAGIVIDGLPQRLRWTQAEAADAATAPAGLSGCIDRALFVEGKLRFDLNCAALLGALEHALESS
jgi:twitching motility protein PilI